MVAVRRFVDCYLNAEPSPGRGTHRRGPDRHQPQGDHIDRAADFEKCFPTRRPAALTGVEAGCRGRPMRMFLSSTSANCWRAYATATHRVITVVDGRIVGVFFGGAVEAT